MHQIQFLHHLITSEIGVDGTWIILRGHRVTMHETPFLHERALS